MLNKEKKLGAKQLLNETKPDYKKAYQGLMEGILETIKDYTFLQSFPTNAFTRQYLVQGYNRL